MDKIVFVLAAALVVVLLVGIGVKLYTRRRLDDIDGWRGIHQKKEFKERKTSNLRDEKGRSSEHK